MSDTRKSRQPGLEPVRVQRDPRVDSTPPRALDEAPLAHLQHVAHTFSRPASARRIERLASLEAEIERLRGELASDADDTAGMLVRIAESERLRVSVHAIALEAGARAGALEAELERASQRVKDLELELDGLRQQWSLSEARLSASRQTMHAALESIEELERREEMAASIRSRTIRDVLQSLRGETRPPASAESSVGVVGTHDDTHEVDWDLDLAK